MKPISVVLLLLLAAGPRMASAQDVTDASEDATGTETSATAEASGAETSDTDDSDDSEESDEQSAEAAPVVAAPAAAVEPAVAPWWKWMATRR